MIITVLVINKHDSNHNKYNRNIRKRIVIFIISMMKINKIFIIIIIYIISIIMIVSNTYIICFKNYKNTRSILITRK